MNPLVLVLFDKPEEQETIVNVCRLAAQVVFNFKDAIKRKSPQSFHIIQYYRP